MFPRPFTFLIGLLLSFTVHSQRNKDKAEFTWGREMDTRVNGRFVKTVATTADAVYELVRFKHEVELQKLDPSMTVVYHHPIGLGPHDKHRSLVRVLISNDRVLVFTTIYDRKHRMQELDLQQFTEADMGPIGVRAQVMGEAVKRKKWKHRFEVSTSPDGSKFLAADMPPYRNKGNDPITVKVMDLDLKELWSQQLQVPERYVMEQLRMDDDGSVLGVAIAYPDASQRVERKREGKPAYDYHLLVFHPQEEVPEDHTIQEEHRFIQDLDITLPLTGDIVCCGLYGETGSFSERGMFYLRLDRSSKQIVHESFKDFPESFIIDNLDARTVKRMRKRAAKKKQGLGVYSYVIRNIRPEPDGSVTVIAEQYASATYCYQSRGVTYCYTSYYYGDIGVLKVDPAGDITWATKIPKQQYSIDDGGIFSGYVMGVKDGRLHFVFNDNGANLTLRKGGDVAQSTTSTYKGNIVTYVTVAPDGKVTRKLLMKRGKRDLAVRPRDSVELRDNSILMLASRKKHYRFGLVQFE